MSLSASRGGQPRSIATPWCQSLQPPAKDWVTTMTHQSPQSPSCSLGTGDTYRLWRNRLISKRVSAHWKQPTSSWLLARSPHRPTGDFSGTTVPSLVYTPTTCHGLLVLITSLGTRLFTPGKWRRPLSQRPSLPSPWPCITGALRCLGNSA